MTAPIIDADDVEIGEGVVIEDGVVIQGRSSPRMKRLRIGDQSFIGASTRITLDDLAIGEYTTIHNSGLIAGNEPCTIGHCCWIGQHTILNATARLTIGNGVGVGAYSQLWTHIHHGDLLQGCRWNATKPMTIEDDVWFVGHCIVSPIHAHARSMALVGSVVTQDMESNHVYAGVPAKDMTAKVGPQFADVSLDTKLARMHELLAEFHDANPGLPRTIDVVRSFDDAADLGSAGGDRQSGRSVFGVAERRYTKRRTPEEVAFMRFLLHGVKFFPVEDSLIRDR